jgi:predicted transcriptional regulator
MEEGIYISIDLVDLIEAITGLTMLLDVAKESGLRTPEAVVAMKYGKEIIEKLDKLAQEKSKEI